MRCQITEIILGFAKTERLKQTDLNESRVKVKIAEKEKERTRESITSSYNWKGKEGSKTMQDERMNTHQNNWLNHEKSDRHPIIISQWKSRDMLTSKDEKLSWEEDIQEILNTP